MKKLLAVLVLTLTGCSTTHSWMDNAKVGTVDDQYVTVLFKEGDRFYRPQFSSDCRRTYNKYFQMDNNSTGCRIAAERVSNIRNYREHVNTVVKTNSPTPIHSNNIDNI